MRTSITQQVKQACRIAKHNHVFAEQLSAEWNSRTELQSSMQQHTKCFFKSFMGASVGGGTTSL